MSGSPRKIDRKWAVKGRPIALSGAILIFVGLGLDICGESWSWLGRLLTAVGLVLGLAGVSRLREDRKKHLQRSVDTSR